MFFFLPPVSLFPTFVWLMLLSHGLDYSKTHWICLITYHFFFLKRSYIVFEGNYNNAQAWRWQSRTQWKCCMLLWQRIIFYYTSMTRIINITATTQCKVTSQSYSHTSVERVRELVQPRVQTKHQNCSALYYPITLVPISFVLVVLLDLCIQGWLFFFL